ncbi:hypothetical protein RF683_01780 [Flavobacterium sp. 20NA77.7]|uniref:Anti-sigma factor n=1 Tax=Flavobacterium nakdongensis TaxID=3073563 RepID=A0ABY9RAD4_9FLAO|nr:hypothetical protein [Flavobacterium sp. 20NA77.7]WMW78197.1 hypothetical protein RF683_01780 [Flavobacterium sp. 20NA77.7]
MALNNFEKQLKKSIQNRTITPSESSWDRLDAMLAVRENNKTTKKNYWLPIAASLLLFSSIGYFFYNQNTNEKPFQQQSKTSIVQKNEQNLTRKNGIESKINTSTTKLATSTFRTNEAINSSSTSSQNKTEIKNNLPQLVNNNLEQTNEISSISTTEQKSYSYITPERLLAEVEGRKAMSTTTKTFKPAVKVNANELLSSVENELNQTFKEKALQKFKEAKSAFANRNYE